MNFPWTDWQFYVVTGGMLGGLWLLVRPFVAKTDRDGCPGCDGCESDSKPTFVSIGGRGGIGQ